MRYVIHRDPNWEDEVKAIVSLLKEGDVVVAPDSNRQVVIWEVLRVAGIRNIPVEIGKR